MEKHLNIGVSRRKRGWSVYSMESTASFETRHPTAVSILLDVDRAWEQQLREGVPGVATGGAEDALRHIAEFPSSTGWLIAF